MIRYYGLYARHRDSDKKLNHTISKEKYKIFLSFNQRRNCILTSFGYDPLKCQNCGTTMLFQELYFNHHRVSLIDLYEKVMRKYRDCRSPPQTVRKPPTYGVLSLFSLYTFFLFVARFFLSIF
jgi:hypothetical protein